MPAGSFGGQYVWHPAADDRRLARACIDVKAGRYLGAERALRETRGDFGTRAHRSLVLASEAADSDLAERWLAEAPGPWPLLARALRLDPWNREAHHRFLAFYFARYGGTASARWDVASFLSHRAPVGSVLRLLPLVALAEEYDPSSLLAHRTWRQPQWVATALRGYRNWLPEVPRYRFTPVLDLSYLAHALYMGRQKPEAREVLTAMGPYAARMPWSAFGDPGDQLTRARRTLGLPVPAA